MTRKLRFPLFFKFLIGCLTLAALLIVGGAFVVRNETRLRSRGNYLQKQEWRLGGYLERVGRDDRRRDPDLLRSATRSARRSHSSRSCSRW
jgi:hypothetical protein